MPKILIIDDDVVLLMRLATQLEEQGYDVAKANEALQGERMAQAERPDLVLIDPTSNQGSGWGVLERLAADMPVIAISSDSLEESIVRGLAAGAADFLGKPIRSAELLARIRSRLPSKAAQPSSEGATTERLADTLPSTTDPVDRLRRPSDDTRDGLKPSPARRGKQQLGERRIELPEATGRAAGKGKKEEPEPVFISAEEEHRLFADPNMQPDEMRLDEINQLPLGARLKTARQRRRLTLVQAELDTKLRMYYVQAMEEEKFSLLPSGSAAEEMLRTYGAYLGLNVAEALDEYRRRHFSNPTTPPIALGGVRPARQLPRWITWVVAVILALALGGGAIYLFDPNWLFVMGDRAWALVTPPTATPEPTQTPPPTQAPTPTATSTPGPTDTPTLTPTVTPRPTSTPRPTDTPAALTPTVTPRP